MSPWWKFRYAKLRVIVLKVALSGNKRISGGYLMSSVQAVDIADWFVARANREKEEDFGEGISNLKLQKILYFAQAASIVVEGHELFSDDIHAWDYGPVVNSVYHNFKSNVSTAIKKPKASNYLDFDEATNTFLEEVWQLFGKYSAAKLVEMAHNHDPWKNTYDGTRHKVISKESMGTYYKNVFVRS